MKKGHILAGKDGRFYKVIGTKKSFGRTFFVLKMPKEFGRVFRLVREDRAKDF